MQPNNMKNAPIVASDCKDSGFPSIHIPMPMSARAPVVKGSALIHKDWDDMPSLWRK